MSYHTMDPIACTTLIQGRLLLLRVLAYCLGASSSVGSEGLVRSRFWRAIPDDILSMSPCSSDLALLSAMIHGFAIFL